MALYVSCMYFRYSYDPFQQSLNDNPEYELPLSAGDYVLIWGNVDDVSINIEYPTQGLTPQRLRQNVCFKKGPFNKKYFFKMYRPHLVPLPNGLMQIGMIQLIVRNMAS